MKETLFLTSDMFGKTWFLKDSTGHRVAQFPTVDAAKEYALQMNYRLQIRQWGTGNAEWFN